VRDERITRYLNTISFLLFSVSLTEFHGSHFGLCFEGVSETVDSFEFMVSARLLSLYPFLASEPEAAVDVNSCSGGGTA
jgi:hypothetical protein